METREVVLKISHGMIRDWWDRGIGRKKRNEAEGRMTRARMDRLHRYALVRTLSVIYPGLASSMWTRSSRDDGVS